MAGQLDRLRDNAGEPSALGEGGDGRSEQERGKGLRFFGDCRGKFRAGRHCQHGKGERHDGLSRHDMTGKTLFAGSFCGWRLGLMMIAARHRIRLVGIGMHYHGLTVRIARRHDRCRQPVQGQADQHGEQHDQTA